MTAPAVTIRRVSGATMVEVTAANGQRLPDAWLTRWRLAAVAAVQHPDDIRFDDGSSYVAARVRTRRAAHLVELAEGLR